MIFYDCSTAPNPRRARMFLAEKGLSPETHDISIAKGEQLDATFLAVNPRATIPVLVTDTGTVLTENLGIAAYLEAAHPEPPLMGRDADEKGLVLMWNSIVEQQGGAPVAEVLRNTHPAFENRAIPGPDHYAQIPELAERGQARTARFFDLLEERLQDSPFLATDHFTLADISAFVFVDFARVIKMRVPEANTATLAWQEAIRERPSSQL
ncbi:glutathione S-transferase [Phaeobacter gallaeciensis]|uniref:Glutathione S-transferase n=1 Tax=Phaeobacter gallaeciensis TaxID=60890 RepID=A0A1B0ZTR6_9RHOB|nr:MULTISPECIES: glutathione S-transferase [Phaeobacter]MEE2633224.1 glutathione S-transferase [Pseudomonadota bacterium]ANP37478.1 glutathione S-transferase [Phaeobacter gallaeciensis]MDE4059686.1 glutathione S-transferase [Phaeobacter gallaeciensis]MDE4122677.1 glutathione S-transferase [Phaeobacter gallaeciensis]MDE4127172.1 glutathione S-transferase [Phaeobacter gallaeciensis]